MNMQFHPIKTISLKKGTVELYYALLNEIREEYGLEKITAPRYEKVQQDVDEDEGTVWEIAAGACDDRFAYGGRISAVRDAACISYRNYGFWF